MARNRTVAKKTPTTRQCNSGNILGKKIYCCYCCSENSCFLYKKKLPGDLVLADWGFNIQATLAARMDHVKNPNFTRGKSQLAPVELETTGKLPTSGFIAIGCVCQKYTILEGVSLIDFLIVVLL